MGYVRPDGTGQGKVGNRPQPRIRKGPVHGRTEGCHIGEHDQVRTGSCGFVVLVRGPKGSGARMFRASLSKGPSGVATRTCLKTRMGVDQVAGLRFIECCYPPGRAGPKRNIQLTSVMVDPGTSISDENVGARPCIKGRAFPQLILVNRSFGGRGRGLG
jgi:hypothetical protein